MSKSKNKLRSFLHAVVVRVGCLSSPVEVNTEETNTTNAKMHIVDRREAMREKFDGELRVQVEILFEKLKEMAN